MDYVTDVAFSKIFQPLFYMYPFCLLWYLEKSHDFSRNSFVWYIRDIQGFHWLYLFCNRPNLFALLNIFNLLLKFIWTVFRWLLDTKVRSYSSTESLLFSSSKYLAVSSSTSFKLLNFSEVNALALSSIFDKKKPL